MPQAEPPPPPPAAIVESANYVTLGAEVTNMPIQNSAHTVAGTLEFGRKIAENTVDVHVVLGGGAVEGMQLSEMRFGVDVDQCTDDEQVCAFVGIEKGWAWWGVPNFNTGAGTAGLIVPRLGMDMGGRVRFRVTLDARFLDTKEIREGVTAGIAMRF